MLAALGTAITGGLVGCSNAETTDASSGCGTSTIEADSNRDVLRATVTWEEEKVLLEVWLVKPDIDETNINTVKVFNSEGDLRHEMSTQRRIVGERPGNDNFVKYYQTLGFVPYHGHVRVEAQDGNGKVVDFREFTFSCNSDPYE